MAKQAKVCTGSAWADLASATTDLTPYSTTAQMNTAITAGVGLVPILTQTIGSAVSSVVVNNAFSANFNAYKIIISDGLSSAGASLAFKLGSSTSTYNYVYFGVNNSGTADIGRVTSASSFADIGNTNTNFISTNLDIINPFLAKYTLINSSVIGGLASAFNLFGSHQTATSYTDFTLTPSTGTLTGGTIRVYGYKN
jgi:hypothetical protein